MGNSGDQYRESWGGKGRRRKKRGKKREENRRKRIERRSRREGKMVEGKRGSGKIEVEARKFSV